jgi:hypothetical protein
MVRESISTTIWLFSKDFAKYRAAANPKASPSRISAEPRTTAVAAPTHFLYSVRRTIHNPQTAIITRMSIHVEF